MIKILGNSIESALQWAFVRRSRNLHDHDDDDNEIEPSIRGAVVASEASSELATSSAAVEEIDRAIEQAQEDLAKAEDKERFLGMRIYKYQNELHERRLVLDEQLPPLHMADDQELDELLDEENPDDGAHELEEAMLVADRARLAEKWEADCRALEKVIESHKTILMHCETIRRQLRDLESKRKHLDDMRSRCGQMIGQNGIERPYDAETGNNGNNHAELGLL